MRTWFERWPQRLEQELRALESSRIDAVIDETARGKGVIKLALQTPTDHPAGRHRLTALFPVDYPFFQPLVVAHDLDLPRHQNPYEKNLCLLDRPTFHWNFETTLAEHLGQQLPKALEFGAVADAELVTQNPREQAEPVSMFFHCQYGSFILVDPSLSVDPALSRGHAVVVHGSSGPVFRGALVRVKDEAGSEVRDTSPVPTGYFKKSDGFRWIRIDRRPPRNDPRGVYDWLRREHSWVLQGTDRGAPMGDRFCGIAGILFPEEVRPGVTRDGWLFLVRVNTKARVTKSVYLARAAPYGRSHLFERIPELSFLRHATVAQAGLGCVGAPIAMELARAGVGKLRVLDGDVVDSGTTVRWPFGLEAIGRLKTEVISGIINRSYPWTTAEPFEWQFGRIHDPADGSAHHNFASGQDLIDSWVKGADVIVDTTAEWGVHFFLSELARQRGVPYILISGSAGGWGGTLFRYLPGTPVACWSCLAHASDGEMSGTNVQQAPEAPEDIGRVQPRGCGNPTFTGAGFDLGQVALAGARFAVMTLSSQLKGGYPDVDWNYATVSLRDLNGMCIAPTWNTQLLQHHPDCGCQ